MSLRAFRTRTPDLAFWKDPLEISQQALIPWVDLLCYFGELKPQASHAQYNRVEFRLLKFVMSRPLKKPGSCATPSEEWVVNFLQSI